MTAKQLIEILQKQPQDALIIQAYDDDSNRFYVTEDVSPCVFIGGYIEPEDEDDALAEGGVRAVCFWP